MHAATSPLLSLLETQALFPRVLAEKFPHVLERIADVWDSPEAMEACISELMLADPRRTQGFPQEAMTEIFAIARYHDALYPKQGASALDVWSRVEKSPLGRPDAGDSC